MMRHLSALLFAALLPAHASAACEQYIGQAESAEGDELVAAYDQLAQCDSTAADGAFGRFLRSASEVDTVVELSLVAIDHQIYTPVWSMLDAVKDYGQRASIAKGVGAGCAEHPQVVQFLQGAYYGLRDIEFVAWDDALIACESDALTSWMEGVIAKPPASTYDEKYSAVMGAYVEGQDAEALPVLRRAAIDAATKGGPFNAIVEQMSQAVTPDGLGAEISDENRAKLQEALVAVAQEVGPEQAALVADRLYNAGAQDAAASLLPRVYPERVQDNGMLLYGAASIEACDDKAVVHWAVIWEPAERWSILGDLQEPLRAVKSRLRCDTDEPWPVVATAEPVRSEDDAETWAETVGQQWEDRGYDVKVKEEKKVVLR